MVVITLLATHLRCCLGRMSWTNRARQNRCPANPRRVLLVHSTYEKFVRLFSFGLRRGDRMGRAF